VEAVDSTASADVDRRPCDVIAPATTDCPDATLLSRCRAQDPSAWRALYDDHFSLVHRWARRLGTPPEELEDVVQDVFVVVHKQLDQFQDGRFPTWLYRICANVVSHRHRRRRVRRAFARVLPFTTDAAAEAPPSPERHAEQRSARRAVERVLEKMAPKKREVLVLAELEGLKVEEIAELVGCGVPTVCSRLHHARKEFLKLAGKLGCLERGIHT
jgi:RNA polymerase sigma-70 factor (ECF subfamily)